MTNHGRSTTFWDMCVRRPANCKLSSWSEWSTFNGTVWTARVSFRNKTIKETCGGTWNSTFLKTWILFNTTKFGNLKFHSVTPNSAKSNPVYTNHTMPNPVCACAHKKANPAASNLWPRLILFSMFLQYPELWLFSKRQENAFPMLSSKIVFSWWAYCFVGRKHG